MDMSLQNSLAEEKAYFLKKIKTNPLFLLTHFPSLSSAALSRLQRSARKKQRPAWLKDIKSLGENLYKLPAEVFIRIPEWPEPPLPFVAKNDTLIATLSDPEDYFAANRFSDLIGKTELSDTVINWLSQPPAKNDAAWETYSTCERAANLLLWLQFIPKAQRVLAHGETIVTTLNESMRWIFNHLEYYGFHTSNHILNNARVLVTTGVALGNENAIKAGMRIFKHMLPILIQKDGFLRERSSHYQLIVLGWLLDAYHFLQFSKTEFLKEYIQKMASAASLVCDHLGNLQVYIGDISPDCDPVATCQRLKIYQDFWPTQTTQNSKDDWHIIQDAHSKIILNYPTGKYPCLYPSHGHNDITSFNWIYDTQPILIDTGRARYSKEPNAIMQKSAAGHNVPLVNHKAPLCESFAINGHWWPAPYANATLDIKRIAKDTIVLEHNGFARNTPVAKHGREITVNNGVLTVSDNFSGDGEVVIHLLWHLDPSFDRYNKQTNTFSNVNYELMLNVPSQIITGVSSCRYGYGRSHLVLITQWNVNLPFTSTLRFEVKKCVV